MDSDDNQCEEAADDRSTLWNELRRPSESTRIRTRHDGMGRLRSESRIISSRNVNNTELPPNRTTRRGAPLTSLLS